MLEKPESIDKILPYGELIRGFANQGYLSTGDLKNVLRQRGIFFSNPEKENMVPVAISILFSPKEFDELRECQITKEDNEKKISSILPLNSKYSIIDSIDEGELFKDLNIEYSNYKLTSHYITTLENDINNVLIEYEIEREDLNKSWFNSKNLYKGSISIKRINDEEAKVVITHTSPETKDFANKFNTVYLKKLKERGFINKDMDLRKILFNDFSNEDRIVFFWRLTSHSNSYHFKFRDILDIGFKPIKDQLPPQIDWMQKKKELIFKGDQIHETFFIKEKIYHPYLIVWKLDAEFSFDYLNTNGKCVVSFDFPNYGKYQEEHAELEINISSIDIKGKVSAEFKNRIKQNLLKEMDDLKMQVYKDFKIYLSNKKEVDATDSM